MQRTEASKRSLERGASATEARAEALLALAKALTEQAAVETLPNRQQLLRSAARQATALAHAELRGTERHAPLGETEDVADKRKRPAPAVRADRADASPLSGRPATPARLRAFRITPVSRLVSARKED